MSGYNNDPFGLNMMLKPEVVQLLKDVAILQKRVSFLEANQKPIEQKRKTLGEIAFQAFDPRSSWSQTAYRENYNNAARAVAEAIIERYLDPIVGSKSLTAAIREEFEE